MASFGRMLQKAILGRASGRIARRAARAFLYPTKVWVKTTPPKEVKK